MPPSYSILSSFTTWLTLCLLASSTTAQLCYRPNGQVDSSDYQPCNKGKTSMCCATNRTDNYLNICTTDGLCQESGTQAQPGANTIWREGCTDPTWKDPACIKLCVAGFERNLQTDIQRSDMNTTHMVITKCSNGSLCCGEQNTACCNASQGVWLQNGVVYQTDPNATSTPSAATISSTSTSTSSPSPQESGGLGTSAKIAIAVLASIIGLVLLIIIPACIYRVRRRRRAATIPADDVGHAGTQAYTQQQQYSELSGRPTIVAGPLVEKDAGQNTFVAELPGAGTETGYRRVPQVP